MRKVFMVGASAVRCYVQLQYSIRINLHLFRKSLNMKTYDQQRLIVIQKINALLRGGLRSTSVTRLRDSLIYEQGLPRTKPTLAFIQAKKLCKSLNILIKTFGSLDIS